MVWLLLAVAILSPAQSRDTLRGRMEAIEAMPAEARDAAVRALLDSAGATPIVSGEEALFLAKGIGVLRVVGDFNSGGGDPSAGLMKPVPATAWAYRLERFRRDARIEYRIAHGEAPGSRDPHNPHTATTFGEEISVLRMPGYAAGPSMAGALLAGRLETVVLRSRALDNNRLVTMYVPANQTAAPVPIVYFGDGSLYLNELRAHEVIDALVESRSIPPIVAVFVPPVVRRDEYRRSEPFRTMMVSELVPLVEERTRAGGARARRFLVGSSRGGLMSLDLALAHPSVFAGAGLLSPALTGTDVLTDAAATSAMPLRVVIVEAEYDREWRADAAAADKVLRQAGHTVVRWPVPDGHNPTAWRAALPALLRALLTPAR